MEKLISDIDSVNSYIEAIKTQYPAMKDEYELEVAGKSNKKAKTFKGTTPVVMGPQMLRVELKLRLTITCKNQNGSRTKNGNNTCNAQFDDLQQLHSHQENRCETCGRCVRP